MKALEFYQVVNGLSVPARQMAEAHKDNKDFTNYKNQVDSFVQYINKLREDRTTKVNKASLQNMVDQLSKIRQAANKIKETVSEDMSENISRQIGEIEKTVSLMDVTKGASLTQALDNTETPNLTFGANVSTAGANFSSRRMVAYENNNKKRVEGYFTPEETIFDNPAARRVELVANDFIAKHSTKKLNELVSRIKKSEYGYASLIAGMKNSSKIENADPAVFKYDEYDPREGYSADLLFNTGILKSKEEKLGSFCEDLTVVEFLNRIRIEVKPDDIKTAQKHFFQYGDHIGAVKGTVGSTVASRNVAFSNVANLLGMPELVAKAVPMTVNEGGKKVEGVFMEKAKGLDFPETDDGVMKSAFYGLKPKAFTDGALRQLADLQILDYLCQNVDRHQNNMLYDIKDGSISNIQAIDNDSSFGTLDPADNTSVRSGVALNDITVISPSAKAHIEKLQPETLTASLSGLGLSDAEITAACNRLDKLKKHLEKNLNTSDKIEAGKIKVVGDNDWGKENFNTLALTKDDRKERDPMIDNIFGRAKAVPDIVDNVKYKQAHGLINPSNKPAKKRGTPAFANAKTEKVSIELEDLTVVRDKVASIKAALEANEKSAVKKIAGYKDMMKNINKLLKFEHKEAMDFDTRIDYQKSLHDLVSSSNKFVNACLEKGSAKPAFKTQFDQATELVSLTSSHETLFKDAMYKQDEDELEEVASQLQKEQKQFDAILDTLASKLAAKLPGVDKTMAMNLIMDGPALKQMMDDPVNKGEKRADGSLKDETDVLKEFAQLAKSKPQALVDKYLDKVAELGKGAFIDEMHSKLYDQKVAGQGGKKPGEMTFRDNTNFKDLVDSQNDKINFVIERMNKLKEEKKPFDPKNLSLAFAELTVVKHLSSMQDKTFNVKAFNEACDKVKGTDYESAMEKISADPAFAKILEKMPKEPLTLESVDNLYTDYLKTLGEKIENEADKKNLTNHKTDKLEKEVLSIGSIGLNH